MKVFVAYMTVLAVTGSALRYDERPRVFCGRALAEARTLYCFGSEMTEEMKRDEKNYVNPPTSLDMWPWFARRFSALSKRTPGLVDECCLKPCYVSQLLSYLSLPTSLDMWPWFATSVLSKRPPGLDSKCCLKSCYFSQLLIYCYPE